MAKLKMKDFLAGENTSRNDISMGDKHQDILRRTWPTLRKDLEPIKLLPRLVLMCWTPQTRKQLKRVREKREKMRLISSWRFYPGKDRGLLTCLREH